MSDDTDTEPTKAELIRKVDQLESEQQTLKSQLKRMLPSRRDALKAGAAASVGIGALGVASDTAESATGSAGTIGSSSDRPDIFADEIDANQFTGQAGGVITKTRMSPSVNNSSDPVDLDSTSYDPDNNFNGSAYIVPDSGTYQVHAGMRASDNQSGRMQLQLIVNGSPEINTETQLSGDFSSVNFSNVFEFSANDSLELGNPEQRLYIDNPKNTYLTVVRIA
jgi:hypothetical protein